MNVDLDEASRYDVVSLAAPRRKRCLEVMMRRSFKRVVVAGGLALLVHAGLSSAALAQGGEISLGLARLGSFPVAGENAYRIGGLLRAGLWQPVGSRIRVGAALTGIVFNRPDPYPAPCPFGPTCNTQIWVEERSGLLGISAIGEMNVDARGHLFLTGGLSENDVFLFKPRVETGLTAGVGIAFPLEGRVGVLKAEWTELLHGSPGPSRFLPITFGVRF